MPEMIGNVLNWASDIDDNTLEQAAQTASLPFLAGHLALMPDAHFGFGSTVGSVIPTKGAIIPAAIGVDIGCGMIAVETCLTSHALPDTLGPLHGMIRERVPAGMGQGERNENALVTHYPGTPTHFSQNQEGRATKQFGSLGGGNHFIEVCLDERDVVWVVLHSGSRGIGNELATIHIKTAQREMADYFISLPDKDLAYLIEGRPTFEAYIADMLWAQEYALGNREAMMDEVLDALCRFISADGGVVSDIEVDRINSHHNFTERENHHGQNVWLTRKGAVRARVGDRGVIPGSMGAASYIVSGLGNPASYDSCSHGAGRRMSRGRAFRELTSESLVAAMDGKTWNDRDASELVDEHPDAYKSIDQVMADQADLVHVEHTLHQVLNYKGVEKQRRRRK